jgi:hypothetical protein
MTAHLHLVRPDETVIARDAARELAAKLWDECAELTDMIQHARDWISDEPCTCTTGLIHQQEGIGWEEVEPCARCVSLSILTLPDPYRVKP